ncbi:succinate-semialdehyde dehydrogenase (NADP+) [Moesziomyces antarcticus]|uniref:Related to UGA2 - succinate semialdehyde dehydrogenase n=2 Tax=Pseudozyma antarctica TaxID=84753 RepID=A0A5C3FYB5_PSEA2|nr:succinate-semialdehyde dehydrogenase (NADP+) [Moesziomyces antarcticus]GAK66212.1 succinate-semialdehyde dehydrogenase (NADP+) [Moesziomyces antarcticus]SPO49328.1 related to UGA2 - succinate semialdehyde dehydrogenase [Moesziomyces antarcticus]SPO49359.1 related to UGA2 - succinate semialdehyde dehydrogenase [Moesziomyces antarcticus]
MSANTNGSKSETSRLKDPSLFITQCVIGSSRVDSHSGKRFDVVYPGDRSVVVASIPECNAQDVDDAVASCHATFNEFKNTTARQRSDMLRKLNDLTLANIDDLATLIVRENGKTRAEAEAEVKYAASFLAWFANMAETGAQGETISAANPAMRVHTIRQPIGVVACLLPWNLPLAMATRKIGPALAAGCTCVVKPAGETPLSTLAFAELVKRAGYPDGCVNVVTTLDNVAEVGKAICEHKHVRKVSLTGSTRVGKLIAAQSAGTLKKLSMELGGNSPVIVMDDADLDKAITGVLLAKLRTSGQTCVAANRILVQSGIHDEFLSRLAAKIKTYKQGDGEDPSTLLGPLITDRAVEKCRSHVADALSKGAQLYYGPPPPDSLPTEGGFFYPPTILTGLKDDMQICSEETFGPVAAIRKFSTEQEAVELANDSDVGLGAYVYTNDLRIAARMSSAIETGMIGINTGMLSACESPFGGVKESGYGKEGSIHGMAEYQILKTITTDVSG